MDCKAADDTVRDEHEDEDDGGRSAKADQHPVAQEAQHSNLVAGQGPLEEGAG